MSLPFANFLSGLTDPTTIEGYGVDEPSRSASNNPYDYGFTGVGGTGPGSMYVLPGEGVGERAETGLTTPEDTSPTVDPITGKPVMTAGGTNWLDTIKGLFTGSTGGPFGQMAAFGGLAALLNKLTSQQSQPIVGYQGEIPKMTFERQQTPIAQQRPEGYRPGQGGISYFTPGTFTTAPSVPSTTVGGTTGGVTDNTAGGLTRLLPTVPIGASILSALTKGMTDRGIAGIPGIDRSLPVADPTKPAIISSKAPMGYDYSAAPIQTERERQINDLYRSILNRDAEVQGLDYWNKSGLSIPEISTQIKKIAGDIGVPVSIPENLPTVNPELPTIISSKAPVGYDYSAAPVTTDREKQINDIYRNVLNRDAETEGLKYWRDSGLSIPEIETQIRKIAGDIGVAVAKTPKVNPNFDIMDIMDYAAGGYMPGGITMLAGGRYLRGPGDGVSDSIPARFEQSGQPARLADGEFVIDARTVSEIGNGSSEAGARKLYAMMDRVHKARKTAKRGEPSKADKYLPK